LALGLASLDWSGRMRAQSSVPQFPREGARQVLDSSLVTAWDVTWIQGKPSPSLLRRFDQVSVTISEGSVRTTRPDRSWTIEHYKIGSVSFESKGTAASEEGVSAAARRAITVELKSYAPPRLDAAFLKDLNEKRLPGFFREAVRLFENDKVIVWDKTFRAGSGAMHAHYNQFVGVFIEGGVLNNRARAVGEMHVNGPDAGRGQVHQEEVQKPLRGIYVEYKPIM
jgi:hypothetical protein